jgi:RHS repeat-associated protein
MAPLLRLPGQYFDSETGLHYNWLRYYEPQTGRYTQYDPLGPAGSQNGFAYVSGDPVNSIDPTGELAPALAAAGAAALAYAKCLAQCALENAALALILGDCLDWGGTVQPCFAECANPLNWLRAPGAKVLNRAAPKRVTNPYGRLGSPAHRQTVDEIEKAIRDRGLTPEREFKVPTVQGKKQHRYMDIVARDPATGEIVEAHQVGKGLQSNPKVPIARERDAFRDVRRSPELRHAERIFHTY